MNFKLKESAPLVALVAASVAAVGCQNPAWQNPYAAIGPATVPAPNMQATPQPGYYQPPAAAPTISGAAPAAAPAALTPPTVTLPDGTIRTEIPATRSTATPAVAAPARDPLSASGPSKEAPIRIVEASPARPAGRSTSGSTFATAASDAPAAVIAANPASRSATSSAANSSAAPAVQFNPSTTTTPTNSTLNRTRGYMPPAAPSTVPKNRTTSVPSTNRPGIRRDSSVSQAAFVETANNANGTWKAR